MASDTWYPEAVNINVAADGSYTVDLTPNGGKYWNCWSPNMTVDKHGGFYFDLDGKPAGAQATVFGDAVVLRPGSCLGSRVLLPGQVTVNIGAIAAPGVYSKENDVKSGGDQCDDTGMARYSVHSMLASLNIVDTPLRYIPPIGPPVKFTVTYNQQETQQPQIFKYANLGRKWTFNWLSYVTDDPNSQSPSVSVFMPGGGAEVFSYDSTSQSFALDAQSNAKLVKTSGTTYERRLPDGSKQVFGLSDGATAYPRRLFMTQLFDSAGNAVSIQYDASFRIVALTDAVGRVTTLAYQLAADPLKITQVTDPFGRSATFSYTNGQLTAINDEIGIQSQFAYASGSDFINTLTTSYGTTTFISGQSGTNRWVEITDPLGAKERVEYRDRAPGISVSDLIAPNAAEIANASLDLANTFYWDKKAMQVAPGDYTKAKITHWLYSADGSVSGIASSEKEPLENRVWYTYDGQPDYQHVGASANPLQIARVVGNGTTQLLRFEYNTIGKISKVTDPVGRVTSYTYDANNIDLLEVRQTVGASSELLRKITYNAKHEPLTDTDTAGQTTSFTYNAQGQLLTRTNAKSEVTTFAYGGNVPANYLASITSPPFNGASAVTAFTYDNMLRVRTVTDPDSYTVTTDYDNLDRKIKVTYPDNSYQQFQYTDNNTGVMTLDLTGGRDRRGLWTYRHYNANRQMDSLTDAANRTTQFGWCTCGALTSITDAKNQTTTFNRDLQSRVYQKLYADGTSINYLYEGQSAPNTVGATSRLQSATDAQNQRTNYTYYADDLIQQVSYTDTNGAQLSPPTPSVTFAYDSNYSRVKSMVDGTGTTNYGYNAVSTPSALGAGRLASIDGPLANDTITFGYDELGRVTGRSVNGGANTASKTFDSLGRLSTETNKLGTFNYSYVGVTERLNTLTFPGGATTTYSYFPNAQDERLQEIKSQTSTSVVLSQFDYTYDLEGQILTWTKNSPNLANPQRYDLGYDNADQLLSAPLKNATTGTISKQYTYAYDLAGNRTSERVSANTTASAPNSVNELVSQSGATNRTLSYDPNGNLISDGGTRTFEWDAANRLVAVNYTGATTRSEFTYDGLSRLAKVVEKTGTTVNSTFKFVWSGNEKVEERNNNNVVSLQTYAQGQYASSTPYYYTRDHLGSVREMFQSDGTAVARYDYDPWGRSGSSLNTVKPDYNYTGLYRHTKSGLDFAMYRAYDPDLGRWLNRDPIAEKGGVNLYGYAGNDSVNAIDPSGLEAEIYVYRASRTSPTMVAVYENGNFLGAFPGNQSGFAAGKRAPSDGNYDVLPKTNYETGDNYVNGTPSITGPSLIPGQPHPGDPAVYRIHPEGQSNGCQTAPLDWADRIWDVMNRNMEDGGTHIHYRTTNDFPAFAPNPRLPAPTRHTWPGFGRQGVEPSP